MDEFLLYPYADTRPLHALTDWLDSQGRKSFSAMLLDMYPKGPIAAQPYQSGQNPFEIARWFDASNYSIKRSPFMGNLWIQGGVRQRLFMADSPEQAPALNKVPLVRWSRKYAYASSSHMALRARLNRVYDESGGEQASVFCCTPSSWTRSWTRRARNCSAASITRTAANIAPMT